MHPTGLPKEYRNIIHYFVPVHICGNYYCIICCNCVAQLPKTKVKKKKAGEKMFLYFTGKMAGRSYVPMQSLCPNSQKQTFKQLFLNANIPELLLEPVERGHL